MECVRERENVEGHEIHIIEIYKQSNFISL